MRFETWVLLSPVFSVNDCIFIFPFKVSLGSPMLLQERDFSPAPQFGFTETVLLCLSHPFRR
jgi:hypothetical protein